LAFTFVNPLLAQRGRLCGHIVRAGARIVSLLVFRQLPENDCSPGFKAV
jgi:hypothetical protein